MKKNIIFLIVVLLSVSCNLSQKNIDEEMRVFKDNTWNRFDQLKFAFPIEENKTGSYDIDFYIKISSEFKYKEFPFHLLLTTPSRETRSNEFIFLVDSTTQDNVDRQKYIMNLYENISLSDTGSLAITIEQIIPKYNTFGFEEAGIVIKQQ